MYTQVYHQGIYTRVYPSSLYHPGYTTHPPSHPGVPVPTDLGVTVPDDGALGSKKENPLGGGPLSALKSLVLLGLMGTLRSVAPLSRCERM